MNLFPPRPPLPTQPTAESRPPLQMRILVTGMAAFMILYALSSTVTGNAFGITLGLVAGTAAFFLSVKLWSTIVLAGPGWLAERKLGSWARIALDRQVTMTSSSSPLVGGDWLFFRHETGAFVALWSLYAGSRDLLEAVRDDHLVHCNADADTEQRLWPEGRHSPPPLVQH